MKGNKSKVLGVLLALALLASLVMVAAPASAATLAWSQVNTPNTAGGNVLRAGSDVGPIAVAPDGLVMFAADNQTAAPASVLLKSTTGGRTWTATNVFQPGAAAADNLPIVAIEVSPAYATDATVWVATQRNVWRSTNGGVTGGTVGAGAIPTTVVLGTPNVGHLITSMDLPANYATSRRVMVGTADTTAAFGDVYVFSEATLAWTAQGIGNVATLTAFEVLAVAFSPQFGADGEIIAVATTGAATVVTTRFSTRAWAADILNATLSVNNAVPAVDPAPSLIARPPASIAFPADYDALNNNVSFVGIDSGAAGTGDVYRIAGRSAPFASSAASDTGTNTDISSVAFSGAAATGILFAGWADAGAVSRSANPTATDPRWTASSKGPSAGAPAPGATNTIIAVAPDFATSNTVHAGTSGVQSAFSRSTDGGATFNARALVDTTFVTINDMALVTGSTIIYLATCETGAAAADTSGIWKSTDGGASWERVWLRAVAFGFSLVALSPNYATDKAVFATEVGTTRIWKSTNEGSTWLGLNAQAVVTAWVIRSADSLVTGAATGQVYRTTNSALTWSQATTAAGAGVNSLQLSPAYATDSTILVGGTNGAVYMSVDGGVNFSRVGTAGPASAAGNVFVAFHPSYATNKTIYAASAVAGDGVFRWVVGTSTAWRNIYALALATMSGILVAPDGTLYAADSIAVGGVKRSVNPTATVPTFAAGGILASPAGTTLTGLAMLAGSNVLYSRDNSGTVAGGQVLTFTDVLSTPVNLTAPANAASVSFSGPVGGGTINLSWEALDPNVLTYDYQVGTNSAFTGVAIVNTGNAATSINLFGFLSGVTYYWRVRVFTPLLSPWSTTRSFIMGLGAAVPGAPGLLAPPVILGTDRVSLTPNLSWTQLTGATAYQVQVNDKLPFATLIDVMVEGGTAYQVPAGKLENSKTYYWRVRGVMGTATFSEWSGTGIFTVVDKAVAPPATVTVTTTATPPAPITMPTVTVTQPAPPAATVTAPAPPAVTVTAPAPAITLPAAKPVPTPGWAWAVIVIGAILVIAVIVLVMRTRRVS